MPVSDTLQTTQSFFPKFFSVTIASCAAPPEIINNGFQNAFVCTALQAFI